MKNIALMISGVVIATSSFAGVAQYTGDTTCHIFHKNKLLKTLKCSYEGAEGASMSYAFDHNTYQVPGFGVMRTARDNKGYDANGNSTGVDITLNDEPAVVRYRWPSNKKIVSTSHPSAGTDKTLECFLSTKSQWEICT